MLENVSERDLVEKEIEDKEGKCPTRKQGGGGPGSVSECLYLYKRGRLLPEYYNNRRGAGPDLMIGR